MAADDEHGARGAEDPQGEDGVFAAFAAGHTGAGANGAVSNLAHARPDVDRTAGDLDQTLSDLDQTASDSDQTASESDQVASDQDQARADADQLSSNRDQAAADREHDRRSSTLEPDDVYEASSADRLAGTIERAQGTRARATTATERLEHVLWRDASARVRDLAAEARDRAADERDALAARMDNQRGLLNVRQSARARAAADRARAAADRAQAAQDRAAAKRDRAEARDELRHAQCDALTGALGREIGLLAIEHEVNRARHGNGRLVLACVDVDRLKATNDREGHAAGDQLLRDIVGAIQAHLRSYDPTVRLGGDEFVCVLLDTTLGDARLRFHQIQAAIDLIHPGGSISVGFARLRPTDTVTALIERADQCLYTVKRNRLGGA